MEYESGGLTGGLARGLTAGLSLGFNIHHQQFEEAQQQATAGREQQRLGLETQKTTAEVKKNEQERAKVAHDALKEEGDSLRNQAVTTSRAWLAANPGKTMRDLPSELLQPITQRLKDNYTQRQQVAHVLYGDQLKGDYNEAKATLDDLANGKTQLNDVEPNVLHRALSISVGQSITDFLRDDGEKSEPEKHADEVIAGVQNNDGPRVLGHIVNLWPGRMQAGLGAVSDDGSTITAKEPARIIPHPKDPTHAYVALNVTHTAPDGETVGTRMAPMTTDGSSDPDDSPLAVPIANALDRAYRVKALAHAVNVPEVKKKLEKADSNYFQNEFIPAFSAVGGTWSALNGQRTAHFERAGRDLIYTLTDEQGNIVKHERIKGTAGSGLAGGIEAIQERADQGLITDDEAQAEIQTLIASRGRGAGGGGAVVTKDAVQAAKDQFLNDQDVRHDLKADAYIAADGNPVDEQTRRSIDKGVADIESKAAALRAKKQTPTAEDLYQKPGKAAPGTPKSGDVRKDPGTGEVRRWTGKGDWKDASTWEVVTPGKKQEAKAAAAKPVPVSSPPTKAAAAPTTPAKPTTPAAAPKATALQGPKKSEDKTEKKVGT